MSRWAMGLGLVAWSVLCSTGCRKPAGPEIAVPAPAESRPGKTIDVVELPELTPLPVEASKADPPPLPIATTQVTDEEQPPSRLLETDSEAWEWPERRTVRTSPEEDEERAWFRQAAEAARAGNTGVSASDPVEEVIIASGTVDGRVRRVRPDTIEVSDNEGNVYELRIDNRSRGLRRGRHIPLKRITEGMPVRASFDLVGGGESLARDIELRR
ncbi:hypothetical protein JRI60_45470 [Archangium violaceum]|uniref:hypothetical protein n=1 Tax=Archangium violaceum TaxID=83451 RepID=UPI00194E71EC|nr:hypothetical protein [Archangium violaceum]QRN96198.1 hypothetical protein JRI60_45470 [Archangium violaceum]